MKKGLTIGIVIIVIILILGAGYFIFLNKSPPDNNKQDINTFIPTTTSKEPSELALELSDFPSNFSIQERAPRVKSDVDEYGISLGWKKGYTVTYFQGDEILGYTIIIQRISIYPLENISKVIIPEVSDNETIVEPIEIEKIGDQSNAYKITSLEDLGDGDTLETVVYLIDFIKKDVYESFTIGGATKDFELLENLAKKSADKI